MTVAKIDPKLIDVTLPEHDGYPEELAKLDTDEALWDACGDASTDFPQSLWIPENEWRDRAEYNDKNGLWAINYLDRFTNQSPTHECTCHALRAVAESAWNRQRRFAIGPPVAGQRLPESTAPQSASVWFSCLSIYAEANPRERGGANVQQVCRIACERGFLPDKIQPRDYGFAHSLQGTCGKGGVNQSSGSWPAVSKFPDGWRETAKHFMPLEVIYPRSREQFVCCLLHGLAIGIGRKGHSVPICRLVYDGGRMLFEYPDSYDVIRYDSSAYYSGSYSILSFTTPDDWTKPAG